MCYRRVSRREVKSTGKLPLVFMVSSFDCRRCLGGFVQVAISPPTDLYDLEGTLDGDPGSIINPNHKTHHRWFCRHDVETARVAVDWVVVAGDDRTTTVGHAVAQELLRAIFNIV